MATVLNTTWGNGDGQQMLAIPVVVPTDQGRWDDRSRAASARLKRADSRPRHVNALIEPTRPMATASRVDLI